MLNEQCRHYHIINNAHIVWLLPRRTMPRTHYAALELEDDLEGNYISEAV